jgi:hypothetical protein
MWFVTAAEAASLAVEAQRVVALRAVALAAGGAAARSEAARMMSEKAVACVEAATTLALGGSARKVVRRYRTRVKANARRLSARRVPRRKSRRRA